jgi:patatin-like phospholipase/acyl hydrolase
MPDGGDHERFSHQYSFVELNVMKKILQIDGGGLKGIIPATVLAHFEEVLGKRCCEVFDLITGTSTGAIIGGVLATGVTDAATIRDMYINQGPKLFTPRVPLIPILGQLFTGSKYDRQPFLDLVTKFTGGAKMRDVKTEFMATTMNLCSGRTHYVYSTDPFEMEYTVSQVISWSALSAAAYFGKINEPDFVWDDFLPDGTVIENVKGAVFQDGGQGVNNCTLGAATITAIGQKWFDEDVIILSLGCGDYHQTLPYDAASRKGIAGQVIDYLSQARNEAAVVQYMGARYLSIQRAGNYTLIRINCRLSKEADVLDGVKWIDMYKGLGEQSKDSVPFGLFK